MTSFVHLGFLLLTDIHFDYLQIIRKTVYKKYLLDVINFWVWI